MWLAVASGDAAQARAVLQQFAESQMSEEELRAARTTADFDSPETQCPACGTQFATSSTRCPECGLNFGG